MVNTNYRFVFKTNSEQNYSTFFDRESGLFIRKEKKGYEEPFWSKGGPELLDISITNYCKKSCDFCYRSSDRNGGFISLDNYEEVVRQASKIGVFQIALGGGNPNYHPSFCKILKMTREKYGLVPSYTSNGYGLSEKILKYSKEFCGAVALSAYYDDDLMESLINRIYKFEIKLNIHFLLTSTSIKKAIRWLSNTPIFLKKINALIFLNYKPQGRIVNNDLLLKNSHYAGMFFNLINKNHYPFKLGFDSCSVSWLIKNLEINENFAEPCEAARFSAFIDEKLNMLPCSFFKPHDPPNINQNSILDIWQNDKVFIAFRKTLVENKCSTKNCFKSCLGGCPLYPNINSLCQ